LFGDQHILDGLGASGLAAVIALFGVISMAALGARAHQLGAYLSAFAVGILSVAVLFNLLPQALDLSWDAWQWVFIGFSVMVLIGIAVHAGFGGRANSAALTFGYASIIALGAHSLLDGAIYAASFQEETFTGWFSVIGLLLHEYPEGVIAYFLLREAGLGTFSASTWAFLAAGATTVIGAIGAYAIFGFFLTDPPVAAMLGGAAGALFYVLIVHLGPQAAKTPNKRGYAAAAFGVIIGTLAVIIETSGGGH